MLEGRNEKGDMVDIHQAFTDDGQSIIVMTAIIGERDYPHCGGWAGPVESITAGKKEADRLFKGLVRSKVAQTTRPATRLWERSKNPWRSIQRKLKGFTI